MTKLAPKRMAVVLMRQGWYSAAATAAILIFVGTVSVLGTMPSSTFWSRDGGPLRITVSKLFPQNWGFFTKEPGSDNLLAYSVDMEGFASLDRGPQSSARNLFGISRSQRSQGTEAAIIANSAPSKDWVNCDRQTEGQCLTKAENATEVTVTNTYREPTLCGNVIIAVAHVRPWSYAKNDPADSQLIYSSAASFEVSCVES